MERVKVTGAGAVTVGGARRPGPNAGKILPAWESPAARHLVRGLASGAERQRAWETLVREALDSGSRASAARSLGVSIRTLYRWAREARGVVATARDVLGRDAASSAGDEA